MCTLNLNLYLFERRNKINQTNKYTIGKGYGGKETIFLTPLEMGEIPG